MRTLLGPHYVVVFFRVTTKRDFGSSVPIEFAFGTVNRTTTRNELNVVDL
jgi:hypothetical protein